MSDYKNTLNLPKTDFPMKANLAQREPILLKKWEKQRTNLKKFLVSNYGKYCYDKKANPNGIQCLKNNPSNANDCNIKA